MVRSAKKGNIDLVKSGLLSLKGRRCIIPAWAYGIHVSLGYWMFHIGRRRLLTLALHLLRLLKRLLRNEADI